MSRSVFTLNHSLQINRDDASPFLLLYNDKAAISWIQKLPSCTGGRPRYQSKGAINRSTAFGGLEWRGGIETAYLHTKLKVSEFAQGNTN